MLFGQTMLIFKMFVFLWDGHMWKLEDSLQKLVLYFPVGPGKSSVLAWVPLMYSALGCESWTHCMWSVNKHTK